MESAVRSTRVESATIATLQKHRWWRSGLHATKTGCQPPNLVGQERNFWMRRQGRRNHVSPQRQKGAETGSANPGTNGTELDGKIPGSQGLGGRRSRMKSIGILGPKGIHRPRFRGSSWTLGRRSASSGRVGTETSTILVARSIFGARAGCKQVKALGEG